ncbi:MAG: hypothetical protein WBQ37_03860 [Candidatus Competibacter sp.]
MLARIPAEGIGKKSWKPILLLFVGMIMFAPGRLAILTIGNQHGWRHHP